MVAGLPGAVGGMAGLICGGVQQVLPAFELCRPLPHPTDYSCALQRDILLQGRLYLSENWICFYSNIFRWETLVKTGGCLPGLSPGLRPPTLFPWLTSCSTQPFRN